MNETIKSKEYTNSKMDNIKPVQPKARLYRIEGGWVVEVALPGVTQDQLKVEVEGPVVRLLAEDERHRYERSFRLPRGQELDEVEASLEAGLLTLKLTPRLPHRRQIEFRSA